MAKTLLTIHRVRLLAVFAWLGQALKAIAARPLRYFMISGFWLLLFPLAFLAGGLVAQSFILTTLISAIMAIILPLVLASISVAYGLKEQPCTFKTLLHGLSQGYNLRLILVYVLLILLICLSNSYLHFLLPQFEAKAYYVMEIVLLILQLLILIALPANILAAGKIPPFQALRLAVKALVINFIPCLLFLLAFFASLLTAIAIAKSLAALMGKAALIIYVLLLWGIVVWMCLAATLMVKELFSSN